jgi:anaphase-promoting complex subunit 7
MVSQTQLKYVPEYISNRLLASSTECFEWVNTYIKGATEIHNRKYTEAVMTLTTIDCLKNNSKILSTIGEAFYSSGDYDRANTYLKRAYDINPHMKHGIQKYAMLCEMFKKTRELEALLRPSSAFPYEYTSENWFVMAVYLFSCLKFDKATYFINRVITQHQHRNVDALILNAKILHSTKKSNEALISLRQALKYEPYRFEVHRWIIEILLSSDRAKDAQNQSAKSLKMLGETPRTLTLAASTFLKSPISKEKAKLLLQRALELNEFYTKAVFFLAQILMDDKEHKAAIKLLEKTSAVVSNIKLSLMLADLYAKNKNLSLALEYYTKVLNIDSTNRHALNGLMALGTTSSSLEKTLEVSSTCGENDDFSAEIEASGETSRMKTNEDDDDSELVWSDVEMDTA